MSTDMESLLGKGWDELPEDAPLPTGTYRLQCRGVSYFQGDGDQSDRVSFMYNAIDPLDDVDADKLSEYESQGRSIEEKRLNFQVWINDGTSLRGAVMSHCKMLGFDPKQTGKPAIDEDESGKIFLPWASDLKEAKCEIIAYVGQRTYTAKDGTSQTANDLSQFSPVDEPPTEEAAE